MLIVYVYMYVDCTCVIVTSQDGAKFYMFGQCTDCCDVANSFRFLSWAEIVKMYQNKAAPEFKQNFELARERHFRLQEDPTLVPAWLPESVQRTSSTGIIISSRFIFSRRTIASRICCVNPLPSRVYELLLEDGMSKEKGLLVPKLKGQDLSHLDHCRDVESVDVCRDAHNRFMRDNAQASFFGVCFDVVMIRIVACSC